MANKVKIDDVNIGDVACEMHLHKAGFGIFTGWDVVNTFEIDEEMFTAMTKKLNLRNEVKDFTKVIGNKFARIVSMNENFSDMTVSSILVIYLYDSVYYAATLAYPS